MKVCEIHEDAALRGHRPRQFNDEALATTVPNMPTA